MGSLDQLLQIEGKNLTLQELLVMCEDTAGGMGYLSQQKIIHRDLAVRNLLVAPGTETKYLIKVADFGMSRTVHNDQVYVTKENTVFAVRWSALEVFQKCKFSVQSDCWSFGIVLWEIFSYGQTPYPTLSLTEVIKAVASGYRMDAPDDCPQEIADMMFACWDSDPEKRPTFRQLYERIKQVPFRKTVSMKGATSTPINAAKSLYFTPK